MKHKIRVAFTASVFALLIAVAPASAFAANNDGSAHMRTATVHDRTPTVHEHASHSRRG